jgi:DNA polymerase III sliding clamp (beta) subunit (PCNA family)
MTKANRLGIKSGSFKAFIDCLENDEVQELVPSGSYVDSPGDFLQAIRKISPFIAEDASRKWARGILFKRQSLFATNNICLVEHWLPAVFPFEANVPQETIRELLRINEEPIGIQIDTNHITFHYTGDRWLASQLYETTWPDFLTILDNESSQQKFPDTFFAALKTLSSFTDIMDRAFINPDGITTTNEEQTGSTVEMKINAPPCVFNLKQLQKLETVATTIDFSLYPRPCIFYGDLIRGAIMGMVNSEPL